MDSSLTVFNYNGSVISRREDGFINLTQMCQANGKRIDHWKELKATQSYISELQENYPGSRVVYAEGGASGGTLIKYRPFLEMKTANGEFVPWVASQSDLLENDWEIFEF